MNFNPNELERQNRTGLSIFTFYIKAVGAHVRTTKGSAVPVAVYLAGAPSASSVSVYLSVGYTLSLAAGQTRKGKQQ